VFQAGKVRVFSPASNEENGFQVEHSEPPRSIQDTLIRQLRNHLGQRINAQNYNSSNGFNLQKKRAAWTKISSEQSGLWQSWALARSWAGFYSVV
jgi:hypothetical protein